MRNSPFSLERYRSNHTRTCIWFGVCVLLLLAVASQPLLNTLHSHSMHAHSPVSHFPHDSSVSNNESVELAARSPLSDNPTHKHAASAVPDHIDHCVLDGCEIAMQCDGDCTVSVCCISPVVSNPLELGIVTFPKQGLAMYLRSTQPFLSLHTDPLFRPPIT